MNKLLLLGAILFLFFPFLVSSQEQQTIEALKQNACVPVMQICANCTYVNVTQINSPYNNSRLLTAPVLMTKTDTVYNYTFCNFRDLGSHIINWKADPNGIQTIGNYNIKITTTGYDVPLSMQFLFIGFIFALLSVGLYKRDITITLLSTLGLYFIGVWMLFYGFNIYKNLYTEAFSFITLGAAAYLSIIMAHEYIV